MENTELFKEVNIKIEPEEYDDSVYHPVEEENYENVPQLETSSSNIHVSRMPGPIEEMEVKNEPIEFNEKQMWSPIREITSSGVEIVRIPADENEIEIKDEPFNMEDVKEETKSLPINKDKFQCDLCIRRYKSNCALREHQKRKHKETLFKCDICSLQFANLSSFKRHVKDIHCSETRFKCGDCVKSFKRKDVLIRHKKLVHERIHTKVARFNCSNCNEKFHTESALASHKYKQHKIKHFQCDICSRGFSTKHRLSQHYESGRCRIKLLPCPICNVRYKYKQNLVRHMKNIHAGESKDCLDEPTAKVARIVTPNANDVVKMEEISMGNVQIDTEMLPTEARNTSG